VEYSRCTHTYYNTMYLGVKLNQTIACFCFKATIWTFIFFSEPEMEQSIYE
jgi:hypothetical protein